MNNGATGKIEVLRCRTLGALELSDSTGREHAAVLSQPKRVALLVYLAVANPGGFHRRDSLLALLWPELDQERARAALRQALSFLRHELGENVLRTRGPEEVGVDPDRVWCDEAAFEDALQAGELEGALELYRGEFLPGFHVSDCGDFERWLEELRGQLRRRAAEAATRLRDGAEAAGSLAEAVRWARRAVALWPDDESPMRRLVLLLDRAGDRAAALREYEAFAARLATDHGIEPSPETQATVAAIRERRDPRFIGPTPQGVPAQDPSREGTGRPEPPVVQPTTGRPGTRPIRRAALYSLAGIAALGGVLLASRFGHGRAAPAPAEPAYQRTAIAVLPFQNLSAEGQYSYFAGGLHEELLTQLSKVAALKVISRTSVMSYTGPGKPPLKRIASELGVGSVVEATVQVTGGQLRVNVQLIDAATDAHLWAEHYDRTLDDAFAIESDIAQQVVRAVGAALSQAERRGVIDAPTTNPEAYRLYLRCLTYNHRPTPLRQDMEVAKQFCERAIAIDPSFALAHARLAGVLGTIYQVFKDAPSPELAARQLSEAQTAIRLAPDLPEAHAALAGAFFHHRDYRRALEEESKAVVGRPSDEGMWTAMAMYHRRLGHWDESRAAFERVAQINPRAAAAFFIYGGHSNILLHRYEQAASAIDQSLRLAPDLYTAALLKGDLYVLWRGQLDTMRAVLNRVPTDLEQWGGWIQAAIHARQLLWERKPDSLLQVLSRVPIRAFEQYHWFVPSSLYAAWAHQLLRQHAAARAAFDSARVLLDSVIRGSPDDWRTHSSRGLAFAGLDRRDEARREAQWLRESFTYREDAVDGPELGEYRAQILTQVGDAEAALDEVEHLLVAPSMLSVPKLRIDPLWDPLRSNPRFQALLEKYQIPHVASR